MPTDFPIWTSNTKEFRAHAVVNSGGSTDAKVIKQVLDYLNEMLYPEVTDDDDHCVMFKIDGGHGSFNLEILAEL
jgi:hypothetical protein